MVSSKLASLGLMQAIISVRLLPPSESCRMRVSLLSRYLQQQRQQTQRRGGCNFRGRLTARGLPCGARRPALR